MTRPLEGLRVVDAASLLAGPFAASILGEFGAEVVKVEQPGTGDPMRRLGTDSPSGDTYWWWSETRNKVSIEVDLRAQDGASQLRALVGQADVLVENFRTGTMDEWGLSFDALRRDNPRLIQLSVSGFGRVGPLARTAGVARIAEAFTGMTDLTGDPGGPPGLSGSAALADYICGVYGALGVLLALQARQHSGCGQMVDMALYDGVARFLDEYVPVYAATGILRQRLGAETHRSVPHNNFEAADERWVTIACTNDRMFDRLAEAMDQPALATDPRFASNAARLANRPAVNAVVAQWVASQPAAHIVAVCEAAGVPAAVVFTAADYVAHPQVVARDSVIRVAVDLLGELIVPGTVPRLVDTPGRVDRLGAGLGDGDIDAIVARWSSACTGSPNGVTI
jgi:crotonobetainyl-CoA:carnitine CoA-transferase CaiB-like acyl-CoA transferase